MIEILSAGTLLGTMNPNPGIFNVYILVRVKVRCFQEMNP